LNILPQHKILRWCLIIFLFIIFASGLTFWWLYHYGFELEIVKLQGVKAQRVKVSKGLNRISMDKLWLETKSVSLKAEYIHASWTGFKKLFANEISPVIGT
jgi:hypothetical protein